MGELQVGPVCSTIGGGGLQFPGEGWGPFVCGRAVGCWCSLAGDVPILSEYFCRHSRQNPACSWWFKSSTVLKPSCLGDSSWWRGEWDLKPCGSRTDFYSATLGVTLQVFCFWFKFLTDSVVTKYSEMWILYLLNVQFPRFHSPHFYQSYESLHKKNAKFSWNNAFVLCANFFDYAFQIEHNMGYCCPLRHF